MKSYSVAFLNLFHAQPSTKEEKAKIGICKYDYTILSDLLFSNTTEKLGFGQLKLTLVQLHFVGQVWFSCKG